MGVQLGLGAKGLEERCVGPWSSSTGPGHQADTGPQHRESEPTSPPCLHLYCFNSNMTFMLETLDATNKLFYFPS